MSILSKDGIVGGHRECTRVGHNVAQGLSRFALRVGTPDRVQIVNGPVKEAVDNVNQTVDKIDLVGAQEANLVALPASRLSPDKQLASNMVVERIDELNVEAALRDRTGSALDIAKLASSNEIEVGTVSVAE